MKHQGRAEAAIPHQADRTLDVDLCVIGGGSGGLSVAAGAAQMGARVALVEEGSMGGDCLNTGCVPSKALLAAAHAAESARNGQAFGVHQAPPRVAFDEVHRHVHGVIAAIAPHDSVERFEGLGVRVVQARGRFTGPDELAAGPYRIRARRFVIATGSRPARPPLPGLDGTPFLTNETIFGLRALPAHLLVLGGGPIGVEMAHAFRRLGSEVTLIERFTILPRDEPEAVAVVRRALEREGVTLMENSAVAQIRGGEGDVSLALEADETGLRSVSGSHLLVAAGREARVDGLGLDEAGVEYDAKGIKVDRRLRTTNRRIFAIGDVAGGPQFTHVAGYHAGIVIRNVLFATPARVDYRALPWVTYTDPELAHVGLTEAEARRTGEAVSVLLEPFSGNDRAQAERRTEGLAKIVLGRRGRILGATLVGPHAGELVAMWALAIRQKLKLSSIAGMIAPYPTLSEISKRVAGSHFTPMLYGSRMRAVVRAVQRLVP